MTNASSERLTQYIYASAAAVPFSASELADLLRKARKNNGQLGIGGMLLHHEGSFLQVLEGPVDSVKKLYEKINCDKRHGNVLLLGKFDITERCFPDWQMGFACTSQLRGDDLNGFCNLLISQSTAMAMEHEADRAHKILLGFREGRYRRHVESDASLTT